MAAVQAGKLCKRERTAGLQPQQDETSRLGVEAWSRCRTGCSGRPSIGVKLLLCLDAFKRRRGRERGARGLRLWKDALVISCKQPYVTELAFDEGSAVA